MRSHTSNEGCPTELLEHLVDTHAASQMLGYSSSRSLYEARRRRILPLVPWEFVVGSRKHLRWDVREIVALLRR